MVKEKNIIKPLFSLTGEVIEGRGKGKLFGMPTANIAPPEDLSLPRLGVYAALVTFAKKRYFAVTNIGQRPSADDRAEITIETFISDLNEDIYGKEITLELYYYLRATKKFASLCEVKAQIDLDIKEAIRLLEEGKLL